MSQAKVDKRKYEKIHRKEIEKKRKIRIAVHCVVAALILGVIIGVPLGIRIYRSIPKFVGDSTLQAFVSTYIDDNYAADIAVLGKEDSTESADSTGEQDPVDIINDAIKEAAANSSEEVEDTNSDSTEDSETSETSEAE